MTFIFFFKYSDRVKRRRLRIEKLSSLIQKRSIIEAKIFASSQNIENALIYADKALAFAFGRRLQSVTKEQKVGSNDFFSIQIEAEKTIGTDHLTTR